MVLLPQLGYTFLRAIFGLHTHLWRIILCDIFLHIIFRGGRMNGTLLYGYIVKIIYTALCAFRDYLNARLVNIFLRTLCREHLGNQFSYI